MGRPQRHVYHVESPHFPPDFPERLERLREGAGLSRRALARALRVDARTLRRWRNGTRPGPGHLYRLFVFAVERGLLHCLLPDEEVEAARRRLPPRDDRQLQMFSAEEGL